MTTAWPGQIRPDTGHWLWLAGPDPGAARAEATRLAWLGSRFPCPQVVAAGESWLVTTAPPGAPASEPERQPRPDDVPAALGLTLRRLHDLPPAGCPFDRGAEVAAEIGAALAQDRLDPARLPPPYNRYRPGRLVELIAGGPPVAAGDRVVCHGGRDPDLVRLDHHILVDVVLGAITPTTPPVGPRCGG